MFGLVRRKKYEILKKENQELAREILELQMKLRKKEGICRDLEQKARSADLSLLHLQQKQRRQERKLRLELWAQVHEIYMEKECGGYNREERCGCYRNPENGKWEVIANFGGLEEPERVLFRRSEDAHCYYELMRLFQMRPDVRASMAQYLDGYKKIA